MTCHRRPAVKSRTKPKITPLAPVSDRAVTGKKAKSSP